ncbi:MAG: MaoC/PaaZ C-terminal domain-containing protein [Gemmatimonadota bacterium]|nr:MaoC/PaaZ C-terminal domain-containing protein [Gemmatimonadota bacterium]
MTPKLQVKDLRTSRLTVDEASMRAFAELSGDTNPIHVDGDSARSAGFPRRVAYAGLLLAEVSRLIGTRIPGPGSLCVSYQFDFKAPVLVGESVLFEVTVTHYSEAARVALLRFVVCREHDQEIAMEGSATVRVPVNEGCGRHLAADG